MAEIFKAYDIRGIYGESLTDDIAFKIGRAIFTFLGCKKVVIGRDMRPHSQPLFDALARGLTLHGADVVDLGLCSTPMSYFANRLLGADASVMITASHNPGPWNGFKICRNNATPISGATGIMDIKRIVQEEDFAPTAPAKGAITTYDIVPAYAEHFRQFADIRHPLNILMDYANAMGIVEAKTFDGLFQITPLFDTLDGTFPNHEANPLDTSTLAAAQEAVRKGKYDFAACFDGDADRVGFLDEKGDIIPMDMITALIAKMVLAKNPGANICYDLRSSWAVKEVILENGGIPNQSRVGHASSKPKCAKRRHLRRRTLRPSLLHGKLLRRIICARGDIHRQPRLPIRQAPLRARRPHAALLRQRRNQLHRRRLPARIRQTPQQIRRRRQDGAGRPQL